MFCSKPFFLLVSLAAISVIATPHALNHLHHRTIAARVVPPPSLENVTTTGNSPHRRRQNAQKCRQRPSSSSSQVPQSTSSAVPASSTPPQPTHTPTQEQAAPVTTPTASRFTPASQPQASTTPKASPPASQPQASTTPMPSASPSPTTTPQLVTTTTALSSSDSTGFFSGINSGQLTFFQTGLGACGIDNDDSQFIVAISIELFNDIPGYDGENPNNNPACNRLIKITYQGNSITVKVVDACQACGRTSLDLSFAAFMALAPLALGRLFGATWEWVN